LERLTPNIRGRFFGGEVFRARAITVFWGLVCTGFAFFFISGVTPDETPKAADPPPTSALALADQISHPQRDVPAAAPVDDRPARPSQTGVTVLELVNIVGSAVNGPILAVFIMTLLARRASSMVVVLALLAGVGQNVFLWKVTPDVSWFWWNVVGFMVTFAIALAGSKRAPHVGPTLGKAIGVYAAVMLAAFLFIFDVLLLLNRAFSH
jgi:hypothetical protein